MLGLVALVALCAGMIGVGGLVGAWAGGLLGVPVLGATLTVGLLGLWRGVALERQEAGR